MNEVSKVYIGWFIIIMLLVFAVIIPGYLFIFLYQKDYFYELDLFRLSILSISVTIPVLTVNTYHFLNVYQTTNSTINFINAIYKAELFSILVIYIAIVIGYFFDFRIVYGVLAIIIIQSILSTILFFAKVDRIH